MNGSHGDSTQAERPEGCEARRSLASGRKGPGKPEQISGVIRSHVRECPAAHECLPQRPSSSSSSSWPPHCKGDPPLAGVSSSRTWGVARIGRLLVCPHCPPPQGERDQMGSALGPQV